jgi:hypothetical protein
MLEPVITNVWGDTAQQWRPSPNWRAEYQKYLAGMADAHVTEYLRRIG